MRSRKSSVPEQIHLVFDTPGLVAGVDEAGRGPLAGPVVAAAVILDDLHPIHGLADSKTLTERPSNATLLKLYALYKQGSSGDVEGKRPGFTDMVGRAKYDAWAELKGLAANDAMQQYIDLVAQLKNA